MDTVTNNLSQNPIPVYSTKNLRTLVAHMLLTLVVFFGMVAFATAQSTPIQPDKNKQTPERPGTMRQQQGTLQNAELGWHWFDDNAARDLDLDDDRMRQLRAMDDRYRREYNALGETPWTHSDYRSLTDRRNTEVRGILRPEQYKHWSNRSSTRGMTPSQNSSTPPHKR